MQPLAIEGLHMWSRRQPERKMHFSSYLLVREGGNVAFDPLPAGDDEEAEIDALGGVKTILLTNRDHERGAARLRERFGARILCSRAEADLFGLTVDGTFDDRLPVIPSARAGISDDVLPGIYAVGLRGAKTPGEVAFVLRESNVAIVGDALLGTPAGALSFLDDAK
ncbi:MAG TPA: MBL fold metallo-hydrolase, partial [Candidatus Tumulicola sp.]|nr:MBL fold metallo-hydrolase [Candidatus Tumulicola sp.]